MRTGDEVGYLGHRMKIHGPGRTGWLCRWFADGNLREAEFPESQLELWSDIVAREDQALADTERADEFAD